MAFSLWQNARFSLIDSVTQPVRRLGTSLLQRPAKLHSALPKGCLKSCSEEQQSRLFECLRNPAQETGCVGAIDQTMVVGERKRQNFARLERAFEVTRFDT
jgi:hypothetical protein